ncbi:MAG TPA: hypothetical protein VEW69_13020 [Alphaproteobacteria bacterium]|nr:hypothetical protein [Alphaproteobacteria bacterium]
MENYFNYFTEVEERFQRRRGSGLLLSTLDWALIETWKEAGIPLEAVLRGIDTSFDTYDRKPSKTKKINSLAYCAQEVLAAAEDMSEASIGTHKPEMGSAAGLEPDEVAKYFRANADRLGQTKAAPAVQTVASECASALRDLAEGIKSTSTLPKLEDLERRLTVLEEKILGALTMTTPEADLLNLRAEADREMAPYRNKMPGTQMDQLRKQFVHKRLFEMARIPRLSLFYL